MSDLSVLLVDDDEDFVTTLAERLNLRGIDTDVAFDGEEALKKMNIKRPDVIILDVMMPGLGGIDVLRQTRETLPDTPVILLTGRGSTREGIDGMKEGAFDYIIKPVKIEELIGKMREAVNNK